MLFFVGSLHATMPGSCDFFQRFLLKKHTGSPNFFTVRPLKVHQTGFFQVNFFGRSRFAPKKVTNKTPKLEVTRKNLEHHFLKGRTLKNLSRGSFDPKKVHQAIKTSPGHHSHSVTRPEWTITSRTVYQARWIFVEFCCEVLKSF